jgi:hypothetical protein
MNLRHEIRRPNSAARSRGVMLVDCLVYLGIFFMLSAVAFSAFYRCYDNMRAWRRNSEDIVRTLRVGELWRDDLRAATGPVRIETSETEQMLHIPHQGGEVLYLRSTGEVLRRANDRTPWAVVLPQVKTSQMQLDKREHVNVWRWEVELQSPRKTVRLRPLFTFLAVPGTSPQR